ncbi:MAG: HAMP domain-containing sensor histidine kinase [Eubacteriales bacterium]
MIKRLQLKFIIINICVLFSLMLSIIFGAYFYLQTNSNNEINEFLDTLISQDGVMTSLPLEFNDGTDPLAENSYGTSSTPIKWFSIKLDKNNQVIESHYEYSSLDEATANYYASMALDANTGNDKIQGFCYKIVETDYGKLGVFADQRIQNGMLENLLHFIYIVSFVSFFLLLLLTIYLSKLAIKPVEESFRKQKTFIADSGHELKTPLTIISANIQMLEQELGKNKGEITGLKYAREITTQTKRMNNLVSNLLTLAKTETTHEKNKTHFNLSKLIEDTALQFEILIFEMNKKLSLDVQENSSFYGCKEDIRILLNILLDNAIKYSKNDSQINISFYEQGKKKIYAIKNQCDSINDEDTPHIFDRFYRLDHSRSRETGGYGLGLSIAKNIVENHHGKIHVKVNNNTEIVLTIIL